MAKRTSSRKRAKRPPLNKIRLYSTQPEKLEQALAGGDDAQWLESYFGEETYQELHRLAQEAKVRKKRGGPRMLILPGIMGSTLGRPGPLWDDIIWIDPIDVGFGNLVELALTSSRNPYRSLGVLPIAYTLLKLRLISAGYDVDYHHFDRRQSIDGLGNELTKRLKQERAQEVQLVAHKHGRSGSARGNRSKRAEDQAAHHAGHAQPWLFCSRSGDSGGLFRGTANRGHGSSS